MTVAILDPAALAEHWLIEAYTLLERGWSRGATARDAQGAAVDPESPSAVAWSVAGALQRAWRTSDVDVEMGLYAFQRANLALVAATGNAPDRWNDLRCRSETEALETVVIALSLVRSVCWKPTRAA